MNYAKYSEIPSAIEQLLYKLKVVVAEYIIIKIDNGPDYDISPYKKDSITDYFFRNDYDFKESFNSIIKAVIKECFIFDYDSLQGLSQDCGIPFRETEGDSSAFLLEAQRQCEDKFDDYKISAENGDFKLNELRIHSINNPLYSLSYEGTFQGDSSDIDPLDWHLYASIEVLAIYKGINELPFYKSLLAESYLQLAQGQCKLSYFLCFSAFESFLNFQLGYDKAERLDDKLNKVFRGKFANIGRHQIYTSIIGQFDSYVQERNNIAHGKGQVLIQEAEAKKLLLFVLTMIYAFEGGIGTFADLGILP